MRLRIRIESCFALGKSQFLDQAQAFENMKSLVDSCEADCGVDRFDFSIDSLCGRMISTAKCKSANRYPLGCCLVPLLAKRLDYGCIMELRVHVHTDYYIIMTLK